MNKSKTVCDKCGRKFTIKLHTKDKDDLRITYFKCPKCYEEYIVNVTDEQLRTDMYKAIELRNKMLQDSDNKEAIRDYHLIKTNNCIRGKQLKEKYLGVSKWKKINLNINKKNVINLVLH